MAANFLERWAGYRTGNMLQTGKPFLLNASDKGLVIPTEIGNHNNIAASGITAHIAISLHKNDIFCSGPCCCQCCGVSGSTSAHDEDVTGGVDRNTG